MKIKTQELEGVALDWAVGQAIGVTESTAKYFSNSDDAMPILVFPEWFPIRSTTGKLEFSFSWDQGGPLLRWIAMLTQDDSGNWYAVPITEYDVLELSGPTPLTAVCRAIVAANLGPEVEIPDELTEQ